MTKKCRKCQEIKSLAEFNPKGKGRTHAYCRPCLYRYQVDRWIQRKVKAVAYKGGKCKICGYNKNHAALGFHHRDSSTKDFEWTKLRLRSWKRIIEELDKCDLVCSNCHAEIHNPDLTF